MGSKDKYNSKSVEQQIFKAKRNYIYKSNSDKNSIVILCVDSDTLINNENIIKNNKIKEFCKKEGYHLVYLAEEIEEVFIGKKISDKLKKEAAERFVRTDSISTIKSKKFYSNEIRSGYSNLGIILDNILKRK